MPSLNLLYKDEYRINDRLAIRIPRVGEIVDCEDAYYSIVSLLTAQPIDYMIELDDIGIKFNEINSYELFMLLFPVLQGMDTSLVFQGVNLRLFENWVNTDTGRPFLYDPTNDIVIDRAVHAKISMIMRKIHHLAEDKRKPGNADAYDYMIKRAREKRKRKKSRTRDSQLESLITALVNTEQFKYNYETARDLTIYQFNESVAQISKKIDYDNRMHGVYAGTVDPVKLSQDDLNWLVHK